MFDSTTDAAQKVDLNRAAEYENDACHELAACLLAAVGRLDNPVNGFDHSLVLYGGGTTSYMLFDHPASHCLSVFPVAQFLF
jgi:hypothetical protein